MATTTYCATAPIGRAIRLTIRAFYLLAVGRACIGQIDVVQTQIMASRFAAHDAARFMMGASLDSEEARLWAEQASAETQIEEANATLPLIRELENAIAQLAGQDYAPRLRLLEAQAQRISAEYRLQGLGDRVDEVTASLWAVDTQRGEAEAAFRTELLQELAAAIQRVAVLEQDMAKAARRDALRQLTAPIAGIVQQLAIRTAGGVVTPAQELMRIVPADAQLIVEADILNRDIGFIADGQLAEIKVETYPFTRHGMLHGSVLSLSRDSVSLNPANGGQMQSATTNAAQAPPASYQARLSVDSGTLTLDGGPAPLAPGMVVTVEIKTGTRTVIDFLLAPLLRYGQESLRER